MLLYIYIKKSFLCCSSHVQNIHKNCNLLQFYIFNNASIYFEIFYAVIVPMYT